MTEPRCLPPCSTQICLFLLIIFRGLTSLLCGSGSPFAVCILAGLIFVYKIGYSSCTDSCFLLFYSLVHEVMLLFCLAG